MLLDISKGRPLHAMSCGQRLVMSSLNRSLPKKNGNFKKRSKEYDVFQPVKKVKKLKVTRILLLLMSVEAVTRLAVGNSPAGVKAVPHRNLQKRRNVLEFQSLRQQI